MNLSHLERPNLSITSQTMMKVLAVYGTITNKYNKEVEIQSMYGGMQSLFIVDGNEYRGDADTDSGFMESIQAGQTTPFTLYAEVSEISVRIVKPVMSYSDSTRCLLAKTQVFHQKSVNIATI